MQPATMKNLGNTKSYWSMLDDAVLIEVHLLEYQFLFVPDLNDIDGRIVVLKKSEKIIIYCNFILTLDLQK